MEGKGQLGASAENDLCSGPLGELSVSADEVGVQVCLDHVTDLELLRGGFVDVLVHVTSRIDDDRFALRADQVRRVCETTEVELLEVHVVLREPAGSAPKPLGRTDLGQFILNHVETSVADSPLPNLKKSSARIHETLTIFAQSIDTNILHPY
jgi:hypothetical protein